MKFYGSMICGDTVQADRILRENNIKVEYIDITANTRNLKEFLALRDSREEFSEIKEFGRIGIPAFLKDDGTLEFDVFNLEGIKGEGSSTESKGGSCCSF